jgi:hypothetical protein
MVEKIVRTCDHFGLENYGRALKNDGEDIVRFIFLSIRYIKLSYKYKSDLLNCYIIHAILSGAYIHIYIYACLYINTAINTNDNLFDIIILRPSYCIRTSGTFDISVGN